MKKSFFEKLTGSHKKDDWEETSFSLGEPIENNDIIDKIEEENEEAQLTVDVYQTPDEIVVQSFVAGLKPEDLDVTITRDMITIKGKRESKHRAEKENYFYQELYWGSFSRSILLPQEIDPDEAEATIKDGLLTITLPKLDRERVQKLKIKEN